MDNEYNNQNGNEMNENIIDGNIVNEQIVEENTAEQQNQGTGNPYTGNYNYNGNNNQRYDQNYNPNNNQNHNPYFSSNNINNNKKKSGKTAILVACIVGTLVVIGFGAAVVIGMMKFIDNYQANGGSRFNIADNGQEQDNGTIEGKADGTEEKKIDNRPIATTAPVEISEAESNGGYSAYDVSGVVESVIPSVVSIVSTQSVEGYSIFGEKYSQQYDASGSGFIVGKNDAELLLATNNHVVENATAVQVKFVNDETAEAIVKGTDPKADLAVIAVKLKDIDSDTMNAIKIATLGDSDSLKVGQAAIVIGNAQAMGQSVTVGCISAKDREIELQDNTTGGTKKMKFIQTDAAINGGNSGGPLLDIYGSVVGISTAKITDTQVEGMCFAIPISSAKPIINELMNRETISEEDKGYLGVSFQNISSEAVQMYGVPDGVYVAKVTKGGPAEAAGIKEGDIVTKIEGLDVNSSQAASEKIQSYKAGSEISIVLYRTNSSRTGYDEINVKAKLVTAKDLGIESKRSSSDDKDKKSEDEKTEEDEEEDPYNRDRRNGDGGSNGWGGSDDWFEDIFPW